MNWIKEHSLIVLFVVFVGLGILAYVLFRNMESTFADCSNSAWAGPQYDWMKGATVPEQFKGKQLLQLNGWTLLGAGDKVDVKYADPRAGANGTYEVLHKVNMSVLIINAAPSPSGGPWAGTIKLAKS